MLLVTFATLAIPAVVVASAHAVVAFDELRARRREKQIHAEVHAGASTSPPKSANELDELEKEIISKFGEAYSPLVHNKIQHYRLVSTPQLREVEAVIMQYPPRLPRGAKRMLNNARPLTQIARDRQIFGGYPRLSGSHLGEWIVLAERWPAVAAEVGSDPALMRLLEDAKDLDAVPARARQPWHQAG